MTKLFTFAALLSATCLLLLKAASPENKNDISDQIDSLPIDVNITHILGNTVKSCAITYRGENKLIKFQGSDNRIGRGDVFTRHIVEF